MADLLPIPMSQFAEFTDINNFSDNSTFPFLDANSPTIDKTNALLKYKNFKQLLRDDLFPITDADIDTGIDTNNLNTGLLTSISNIQVNEYGRVVRLTGGSAAATAPFVIQNVTSSGYPSGGQIYRTPSSYVSPRTGSAWITGVVNFGFNRGGLATDTMAVSIKSSVKTSSVNINSVLVSENIVAGGSQSVSLYISGVVSVVEGETNWYIYPTVVANGSATEVVLVGGRFNTNATFFIY